MKTNFIKRALSIILCVAMMMALGAVAVAEDIILERFPGNTEEGARIIRGNDFYSIQNYSLETDYDGIVASRGGFYAMEVQTDTGIEHIPVGIIEIDLADPYAVAEVLQMDDLSVELRAYIQERHQLIQEGEMEPVSATVFSPELLPDVPSARNITRQEFVFNGVPMMVEVLTIRDARTGWRDIMSRRELKWQAAGQAVQIVIEEVGGFAISALPLVSGFISLARFFINNRGNVLSGHPSDVSQINIHYTVTTQWAHARINGSIHWRLGLVTQSVTLQRHETYQSYINRATGTASTPLENTYTHMTNHFTRNSSNWALAIRNAEFGWPVAEYLQLRIPGTEVRINF